LVFQTKEASGILAGRSIFMNKIITLCLLYLGDGATDVLTDIGDGFVDAADQPTNGFTEEYKKELLGIADSIFKIRNDIRRKRL
jgi:hypothetical protein